MARTMGRTLALAPDAVDINVIAHNVGYIDRHFLMREGGKANAAAAVDHAHGVVDRAGRGRAFDNVVDAPAAIEFLDGRNDIRLLADVDHSIGAKFEADLEAIIACSGKDYRLSAEGFRHRHGHKADWARTRDADALACNQPTELGERVHCSAGGNDEAFLVRHLVGSPPAYNIIDRYSQKRVVVNR
jgi:hypothetical protein